MVVRGLAILEIRTERIEQILDFGLPPNQIPQNVLVDLIWNESVVDQLQLPCGNRIKLGGQRFPLPYLFKVLPIVIDLQVSLFCSDECFLVFFTS